MSTKIMADSHLGLLLAGRDYVGVLSLVYATLTSFIIFKKDAVILTVVAGRPVFAGELHTGNLCSLSCTLTERARQ